MQIRTAKQGAAAKLDKPFSFCGEAEAYEQDLAMSRRSGVRTATPRAKLHLHQTGWNVSQGHPSLSGRTLYGKRSQARELRQQFQIGRPA
jgi:hypothetical protein